MKILKIQQDERREGDENFTYSFYFEVRIKTGFLSYTDARIYVYTNRQELSIDELIDSIESQDEKLMGEVLHTLRTKDETYAIFKGKHSFTTKIGGQECNFRFFKYDKADYAYSHPRNWPKYKRQNLK